MQNAIVSESQCILVTPASKTTFLPEELCIGFEIPFEAVQIIKPNLGSRLLKCGEVTTMSDLPDDLAEEILSRVPLTSLSAVRSTCRKWNDLSKPGFGKSASTGRKQFLGFMLKDYKVCSMKFDLQGIGSEGDR
ncbi:hypothetical protein Bca52824_085795 [Brassica carinata]|uniref:F-box domain-containing protein n=1 Tax=Brassica carinata TaxID=52824 RepID=A0A8X7TLD6_BRACI|nr:hypothetical protein Bca52824_085795 [Brassica carinata]